MAARKILVVDDDEVLREISWRQDGYAYYRALDGTYHRVKGVLEGRVVGVKLDDRGNLSWDRPPRDE